MYPSTKRSGIDENRVTRECFTARTPRSKLPHCQSKKRVLKHFIDIADNYCCRMGTLMGRLESEIAQNLSINLRRDFCLSKK